MTVKYSFLNGGVRIKRYILFSIFILLLIFGGLSTVSATSTNTITITAMDSCGLHSWGVWHTTTFLDKCPYCGGSLLKNPKGTYEHELTCSHCDADFCGYDGRCKSGGSNVYLTRCVVEKKWSLLRLNDTITIKKGLLSMVGFT